MVQRICLRTVSRWRPNGVAAWTWAISEPYSFVERTCQTSAALLSACVGMRYYLINRAKNTSQRECNEQMGCSLIRGSSREAPSSHQDTNQGVGVYKPARARCTYQRAENLVIILETKIDIQTTVSFQLFQNPTVQSLRQHMCTCSAQVGNTYNQECFNTLFKKVPGLMLFALRSTFQQLMVYIIQRNNWQQLFERSTKKTKQSSKSYRYVHLKLIGRQL